MTGFSASWLALREPVDHRSRNAALAQRMAQRFAGRDSLHVTDLGAGTGSNLRALAPLLPAEQHWTLYDNDPALLEEATLALMRWADHAAAEDEALRLTKDGKAITVTFRLHDLAGDIEGALLPGCDLVTASALFDLTSALWMARFAKAVEAAKAAFYTTLTYDGRDRFAPAHPLDGPVVHAFATHMQRDKGFGAATGPMASDILSGSLRQAGYKVERADSPWVMGESEAALARELCSGMANAVTETGLLAADDIAQWLSFRHAQAGKPDARMETGHTDLLACPV